MVTFAKPTDSVGTGKKLVPGEYVWTLTDVVVDEPSKFNPETQRLKFIFTVDAVEELDEYPDGLDTEDEDAVGEFEDSLLGSEHWEWVNNTMGPNSTLRAWLQGMLGRTIDNHEEVDSAPFIGKPYKVQYGWKSYVIQQSGESGKKLTILTIKPVKPERQRRQRPDAAKPLPF